MIDIGLTNALAQIRDALYEVADAIRESKENGDKCDYCSYNGYYDEDYE
jgi:hypothetical protein